VGLRSIKFIAEDEETLQAVELPSPAVKNTPEWYKNATRFLNSNKVNFSDGGAPTGTMKGCIPVFDSIIHGYIQKTWTDVYIERDSDGEITYRWSKGPQIMGTRDAYQYQTMPTVNGYDKTMFTWNRPWGLITPPGYSVLFTHPMYRYDLPFMSQPGIIDTDVYHAAGKNSVPFFLKEGFTGLIPSGTPMYQIIPIKREPWHATAHGAEFSQIKDDTSRLLRSKIYDGYKKIFWQRKEFS
jgi:hypothetical protein